MSRDITVAMKNYLAGPSPMLARLFEITLKSGTVVRGTDYSFIINYLGNNYLPEYGLSSTAVRYTADLSDDNYSIKGFTDTFATKQELEAGVLNDAYIKVFRINPYDHSMGILAPLSGNVGKVSVDDIYFEASVESKISRLKANKADVSSPTCRTTLGSAQCTVNLAPITTTGTVTAIDEVNLSVTVTVANTALIFSGGDLIWTSGPNSGFKSQIKTITGSGSPTFTFFLGIFPLSDIQIGDTFNAIQGCDKSFATCVSLYSNAVNFRGEPNIPGSTKFFVRFDRVRN